MYRLFFALSVLSVVLHGETTAFAEDQTDTERTDRITVAPADWPWWRGPTGYGVAPPGRKPPLEWNETDNVVWKSHIQGHGHGSPTVVGEQIFLASADREHGIQTVLCYDRNTGQALWQTVVHRGGLSTEGNKKTSQASSTVACDGHRVFVNFLNNGAAHTTALNRDGKILWQQKITDYVVHQGYGSSPTLYESLVIVSADNKGGGAIAALDRVTGNFIWKVERPEKPNYTSPIIVRAGGQVQLVLVGCDLVSSYAPLTGNSLWSIDGATTECVTSTVTDGHFVFTSGGYPRNHVSAVRTDGSGEIVWENDTRVYVPSMLVYNEFLYAVLDAGVAVCWKCDTGEQMWKHRLGGTFTASLVRVGDLIHATNEDGRTFVFEASPQAFELVAENELGDEVFATPTICGGHIYMRIAKYTDEVRRETLYCIGHTD